MIRTVEAVIDQDGHVHLLEAIHVTGNCRALVAIFDSGSPSPSAAEWTLLSEASLSEDWNRPEEDAAWAHLQPD